MAKYLKMEDAIEALMCYFIPPVYTGEEVDQAKNLAESILNGVPAEEMVQYEDAIDRYSALAILDPYSIEYEEMKALPSVLIKSPKQEVEEDRLGWVPVSERLPEENKNNKCFSDWVQVTVDNGNKACVCSGYYCFSERKWYIERFAAGAITAWRSLPESYKGE